METKAVRIENLNWSYDQKPILDDICTEALQGTFTTILGPNGSGKTTLLKQLLRILPVEQGTVHLFEEDIARLDRRELASVIGLVPQNEKVPYQFTTYDMIRLGRYIHSKVDQESSRKAEERIEEVMELTSIEHLRDRLITELSGGEYQRVIIARALAQEPRVLALDEPTTYLDPKHQLDILKLLRRLISTEGLTVICVLHDLNSAMSFSDHIILLNEGRIYGHGSPEVMLTSEVLHEVYGIRTTQVKDPFTGKPVIIADTTP